MYSEHGWYDSAYFAQQFFVDVCSTRPWLPDSRQARWGARKKIRMAWISVYRRPNQRGWMLGDARDFVEGMWLILQQDQPGNYVLATGEAHSVREFLEKAFAHIGRTIAWHGTGVEEKGLDKASGETLVEVDPRYFRPTEMDFLLGASEQSASQARLAAKNEL